MNDYINGFKYTKSHDGTTGESLVSNPGTAEAGKKKFERCQRPRPNLPCVTDIYILAGLIPSCDACAPNLDKFRQLHEFQPVGSFFRSERMTASQIAEIDAAIEKANSPIKLNEADAIKARLRQLANDLWTRGVSAVKANDPDILQRAADLIEPTSPASSARDAEVLKVLREVEWCIIFVRESSGEEFHNCPSCGEEKSDGHAPGCRIAALIASLSTANGKGEEVEQMRADNEELRRKLHYIEHEGWNCQSKLESTVVKLCNLLDVPHCDHHKLAALIAELDDAEKRRALEAAQSALSEEKK